MPIPEQITTTVSTKGQIVLPRSVRNSKHWPPGTRLVVENTPEGVLLRAVTVLEETRPEDVFGILKWKGSPKTIEEMDEGILAEARRQHEGD